MKKSPAQAMGSCLLSEANDLKRPLPIVAKARYLFSCGMMGGCYTL